MKTLKYKGYLGSVEFSEEDNVMFGKILGIDALVNYEGENIQQLTTSFHEAVEDYLVFCKEHGINPQKSYSGSFNVRIAPETHKEIASLAAENGITINAFVKKTLDEAIRKPSSSSLVSGYATAPDSAMLMEPEGPRYGTWDEFRLTVPHKDAAFAKEMAQRLGWKLSESHSK